MRSDLFGSIWRRSRRLVKQFLPRVRSTQPAAAQLLPSGKTVIHSLRWSQLRLQRAKPQFVGLLCLGLLLALANPVSAQIAGQIGQINSQASGLVVGQASSQLVNRSSNPTGEIRGVWLTNVDSDVLFSKDNLRNAIRRLDRLNFNTLYPTVWNGGYTLYPSQVAKQAFGVELDPEPGLQERDMLAEAIESGHSRGLAVIPWFEFGLMAPADSELVRSHPDWVTTRRDGSKVFNVHGEDRSVWLTPAHPGVQEFLVKLVAEVVEKYDIEGIQFDDHLGMPVEVGYDDYTVRLYQQEHNGRRPPNNPNDAAWMRWRANKLSELMTRIHTAAKQRNANCVVSLSPNPKNFAYQKYLQDWDSWQRSNYIDELIVQVYRTGRSSFLNEIDQPDLRAVNSRMPVGIGILTGLSTRNVSTREIEDQVRLTRDRRFAGVSFFFYETLGRRDAVFQALFPRPAERPNIRSFRPA
jgi:uncharacterized lipoprotein YddW (UPF0748 family)